MPKRPGFGLRLIFVTALGATLGSLYLSEVKGFTPCILCWYQRIFMYPLLVLSGIALWRSDKNIWPYIFGFSIPGALIAAYHYLLQMGVIPDRLAPCVLGVSCTTRYIEYWGFVTIPFMSFAAFLIIILTTMAIRKSASNEQGK